MTHPELPHVVVCGGRDFADAALLEAKLDLYCGALGRLVLVTGACPRGADALAERWAHARRHVVRRYHADWTLGKVAGPLRNEEMCREVAVVEDRFSVAFWDGKSRGTKNCIDCLRTYGIPLKIVRY
jgi:hypothetical protein